MFSPPPPLTPPAHFCLSIFLACSEQHLSFLHPQAMFSFLQGGEKGGTSGSAPDEAVSTSAVNRLTAALHPGGTRGIEDLDTKLSAARPQLEVSSLVFPSPLMLSSQISILPGPYTRPRPSQAEVDEEGRDLLLNNGLVSGLSIYIQVMEGRSAFPWLIGRCLHPLSFPSSPSS